MIAATKRGEDSDCQERRAWEIWFLQEGDWGAVKTVLTVSIVRMSSYCKPPPDRLFHCSSLPSNMRLQWRLPYVCLIPDHYLSNAFVWRHLTLVWFQTTLCLGRFFSTSFAADNLNTTTLKTFSLQEDNPLGLLNDTQMIRACCHNVTTVTECWTKDNFRAWHHKIIALTLPSTLHHYCGTNSFTWEAAWSFIRIIICLKPQILAHSERTFTVHFWLRVSLL